MTASFSYQRELLIAILVAVWLHVLVFVVFAVLLVFELISGKVIESAEVEKIPDEEMTELTIIFEEDPQPMVVVPVVVPEQEKEAETKRPTFAQTQDDQETAEPQKADFMGEKDTVASSDADAVAGEKEEVALSGDREVMADIKTSNEDFSDGPENGQGMAGQVIGKTGRGDDAKTQEETLPPPEEAKPVEEMAKKEGAPVEFVETTGVEETLLDAMAKKTPEKKVEPKVEETPPVKKQDAQVAKKEGGSEGGFRSKQSKTSIRGTLNASGKGSLNVVNSPLGRYEAKIFRLIEREWQARNYQFRSHLAPGHISIRFLVNSKGLITGQRRLEMRGASDIQWGIILNSITASKIPAMPNEVRKELDGEPLELNVTFNY